MGQVPTEGHLSADARALMAFETRKKSALAGYLLWFLLGSLGAHRFYTGRTGTAVAQLLITVLGWITLVAGIGLFILAANGIWLIVDLFLVGGWIRKSNAKLLASLDSGANPTLVAMM